MEGDRNVVFLRDEDKLRDYCKVLTNQSVRAEDSIDYETFDDDLTEDVSQEMANCFRANVQGLQDAIAI